MLQRVSNTINDQVQDDNEYGGMGAEELYYYYDDDQEYAIQFAEVPTASTDESSLAGPVALSVLGIFMIIAGISLNKKKSASTFEVDAETYMGLA